MARKKKIQLKPKSELGMNRELPMCYNCIFWQKDGWCPWYEDHMIIIIDAYQENFLDIP